jgi:hypothetical protein
MKIDKYKKINDFFKLNGYGPEASRTIPLISQEEIDLIKGIVNNLSDSNNRKAILNIYFNHSIFYVKDVTIAFGIEIVDEKLFDSISRIIVVADVIFDFNKIELGNNITLDFPWDLKFDYTLRKLLNDETIQFFSTRIRELKIKSVFFSDDEFKREMKIPVSNWLVEEVKKSGIQQKLYDTLPELIVEFLEENDYKTDEGGR